MIPTRIRNRSDLILYAQATVPSRACQRAFTTGEVLVLGGFDPCPPSAAPGWILTVRSPNGRLWLIAVTTDGPTPGTYRTREIDKVPWAQYAGGHRDDSLQAGDMPTIAEMAWWRATHAE